MMREGVAEYGAASSPDQRANGKLSAEIGASPHPGPLPEGEGTSPLPSREGGTDSPSHLSDGKGTGRPQAGEGRAQSVESVAESVDSPTPP